MADAIDSQISIELLESVNANIFLTQLAIEFLVDEVVEPTPINFESCEILFGQVIA